MNEAETLDNKKAIERLNAQVKTSLNILSGTSPLIMGCAKLITDHISHVELAARKMSKDPERLDALHSVLTKELGQLAAIQTALLEYITEVNASWSEDTKC